MYHYADAIEVIVKNASAIRAKQAIVTVPVGVLCEGSLRFDPDLPETVFAHAAAHSVIPRSRESSWICSMLRMPTPRVGKLTMRRNDISSSGLCASRK